MRTQLPAVYSLLLSLVLVAFVLPCSADEPTDAPPRPVTTTNPEIPAEELALLLVPLTKSELVIEADGWQGLVKVKAEEIARAEIAVKRQNQQIKKTREAQDQADQAKQQLEVAKDKAAAARVSGDPQRLAQAGAAAQRAREILNETADTVEEAVEAAEKTEDMQTGTPDGDESALAATAAATAQAEDAAVRLREATDDVEAGASKEVREVATRAVDAAELEQIAEKAALVADSASMLEASRDSKKAAKVELLEDVTSLREERTRLLDNLRVTVDELEAKTDAEDADTRALIRDHRLYIKGVSGINLDVTDSTSAWVSIKGWLTSEEGGIRWLHNVATFFGILILAWIVSRAASALIGKGLSKVRVPALLSEFTIKVVRWLVMLIGVIWALAALEVSIAPLLALVGAAGFVIAFAMQDSLSNFASGLMILLFRPFDTGDVVDAGGVSGTVRSMNLVSTTIRTFDNKMMVVPNNKIWGDVITNASNVTERRVDMEFGIGYDDDVDRAQQILEEIVSSHPNVLKEPAPTIRMNALGDSSINFICRPWAKTADYWGVYWDVTREVKRRFDAEGIGIPFPQQDVHLYVAEAPAKEKPGKLAAT